MSRLPVLAALALLAAPLPARAQDDPAGEWTGTWTRSGDTLAVDVRFERTPEGWRGAFDAGRLRVVGIPFTEVAIDPPRVAMRMVGDATTMVFEGRLEGGVIAGSLVEGDDEGTFRLERPSAPPAPIREEEVAFGAAPVVLAGSLLVPDGPGPHPAVVFLHGSGAEGRWASRYLAVRLARAGIAALIWDKRGVGASTGDWRQAGFEDLAADARAAVAFLAARPEIDPRRIGIHGHSQGGTIAPLVAAGDSLVAFVVGSAAAGVSMAESEIFSLTSTVEDTGVPDEDLALARAYVHAVVDVAYKGADRAALDSLAALVRGRPWAFELPPPDHSYWTFSRRIDAYDPLAHWRRVDVPVLLLYGERDRRVPAAPSAAAIAGALLGDGAADVTVRIFPEGGHTFRVPGGAWPRTVPGYPDALLAWLATVTAAPAP